MLTTLNRGSTLTPAMKKEKINSHREYHSVVLNELNVPDNDFNVKLVFYNEGRKVVGIFPNEFTKSNGFYFEFVDKMLDPTDPERKLWKLTPRENYEDLYNILSSGAYAVPIDDLEEVVIKRKANMPINLDFSEEEFKDETKDDEHHSKMTIRDLAAILWQKPVSRKRWLNDLVNEINQQEL